jgi:hypothetical protein
MFLVGTGEEIRKQLQERKIELCGSKPNLLGNNGYGS